MASKRTLVGIIGRKGSGKDTVAAPFFQAGFQNVKFAGGLKTMLRALLAYQGVDEDTIERMLEGDLKGVETPYLGGRTPRYAMETLGTEWGRKLIRDDFWVNMTIAKALTAPSIITDCRFPNEAEALENAGAILFGIVADWIRAQPGEHESERHIDDLIIDLPDERVLRNTYAVNGAEAAIVRSLQSKLSNAIGVYI